MKLYTLLIICASLQGEQLWARDLSFEKRISLLRGARNKVEIIKIAKKMSQYDDLQSECRLQLATKRLPIQCFEQLVFERQLKLVPDAQLKKTFDVLVRICDLQAESAIETTVLREAVTLMDPKLDCVKRLRERIRKKEYQDVETSPLELFESLHKG